MHRYFTFLKTTKVLKINLNSQKLKLVYKCTSRAKRRVKSTLGRSVRGFSPVSPVFARITDVTAAVRGNRKIHRARRLRSHRRSDQSVGSTLACELRISCRCGGNTAADRWENVEKAARRYARVRERVRECRTV